jgi:hypothetical protein
MAHRAQLLDAVETGNVERMRVLLGIGVPANVRGEVRAVSVLSNADAKLYPMLRSSQYIMRLTANSMQGGDTALMTAVQNDRSEAAQCLLGHGADINAANSDGVA